MNFALLSARDEDPLAAIGAFLKHLIESIADDRATLRTFQIILFKCEHVDEFHSAFSRQIRRCLEHVSQLTSVYQRAKRAGVLRQELTPSVAALDTCVFVSGLVRLLLIDNAAELVRPHSGDLIAAHIAGRRAAEH